MSYRCGTNGLGKLGIPDGDPRIICDGCQLVARVTKANGMPAAWFLDNRAHPGWSKKGGGRDRIDLCPRCRK